MVVLSKSQQLFVQSMGKRLKVIAICDNDDEANAYMEKHDRAAVVACFGPLILLADKYDR